jgi:hypothetical protein
MPTSVARTGANLPNGNFLPTIWSKKLQAKFYKQTVFGAIANRDWEGEIKGKGSKVEIRVRPTVTVSDYEVNSALNYQDLTDNLIELPINNAKYYAFKVDDIDVAQSDIKIINECTFDASRQMAIAVDASVLQTVYASAGTSATSAAVGGATDGATVLQWINYLAELLDAKNVPDMDRWLVIPPSVAQAIMNGEATQANLTHGQLSLQLAKGASAAGLQLRNGLMGELARFKLYVSNNLYVSSGTTYCLAGTPDGLAFASQFVKTETLRLQDTFGDAVRGLNVYGYLVSQPDALISAPITHV